MIPKRMQLIVRPANIDPCLWSWPSETLYGEWPEESRTEPLQGLPSLQSAERKREGQIVVRVLRKRDR